jgi:hypothetical protein
MIKRLDEIFVELFLTELELPEFNVLTENNNYILPNEDEMFIKSKVDFSQIPFKEIQTISMMQNVIINVTSANDECLNRKEEIILALTSVKMQQLQAQYGFKCGTSPTMHNASAAEGGDRVLSRFIIIIPCFTSYRKEKIKISTTGKDYYDKFSFELHKDDAIDIITVD